MTPTSPDWTPWKNVQRIVLRGIAAESVGYVLLRIRPGSAAAACDWLSRLLGHGIADCSEASVPSAVERLGTVGDKYALQIGFTFEGLQALGFPDTLQVQMQLRSPAFVQGARARAAPVLGDVGRSAPERWHSAFRIDPHLVLSLHSAHRDKNVFMSRVDELSKGDGAYAFDGWDQCLFSAHLDNPDASRPGRLIHLGLRDGISKPAIRGLERAPASAASPAAELPHEVGEFVLGYPNNDRVNRWNFSPADGNAREVFADASFAALRMIELDEPAWNQSLDRILSSDPRRLTIDFIKSKLIGRQPDGFPVPAEGYPAASRPSAAQANDFDFTDDSDGRVCPYGSHIRRMNPRGGSLAQPKRRPLLRRGLPYGPLFEVSEKQVERGLLGFFFCASLEEQFEHLVSQWGLRTPLGSRNQGMVEDPLASGPKSGGAFVVPQVDESLKFEPLPEVATTRGTVYLFYPSLKALSLLAEMTKLLGAIPAGERCAYCGQPLSAHVNAHAEDAAVQARP